jgi:hypothetical protein
MLWVFLRTRSAVLTAIAQYSYYNGLSAMVPFLSDSQNLLMPPMGLIVGVGALLFGIGLWVWKDPGGEDLAIARVAFDGTPLTPEQHEALLEEERQHEMQSAAVETPSTEPPAYTPPDSPDETPSS